MNTTTPSATNSSVSAALAKTTLVVAVGFIDGACGASAALRFADPGCTILFTQAFAVNQLDPTSWGEPKNVLFFDLAVNNAKPEMTVDFLRRVAAAGHTIVGVCDEHDAKAWESAFEAAGLDFGALAIKPVSGKGTPVNSSGALLRSLLGEVDEHTAALCQAADDGDRMVFETPIGNVVNRAVKANIEDNDRRVYLTNHFAWQSEPDAKILAWDAEYEQMLRNHDTIIAAREEPSPGLVKVVVASGVKIDLTVFMARLYGLGYKVVAVDAEAFNPAAKKKERMISFGCAPTFKVDLLAAIKAAGITASGFASKANVHPDDEVAAIAVVRALLA